MAIVLRERKRLGAVLKDLGLLDAAHVAEAVGLHAREILFNAISRPGVTCAFEELSDSLLDTDAVNETASRDPRYNLPALLIQIDEAASLFNAADKYTRETSQWAVGEIARRCRKYAITLVLITQKATADAIPSAISAMASSALAGSI